MIQPQVLPNLANFTLHAESLIFTTRDQLGGGVVLPPTLVGLQSFQLFLIPEPSVMAIGVIVPVGCCCSVRAGIEGKVNGYLAPVVFCCAGWLYIVGGSSTGGKFR